MRFVTSFQFSEDIILQSFTVPLSFTDPVSVLWCISEVGPQSNSATVPTDTIASGTLTPKYNSSTGKYDATLNVNNLAAEVKAGTSYYLWLYNDNDKSYFSRVYTNEKDKTATYTYSEVTPKQQYMTFKAGTNVASFTGSGYYIVGEYPEGTAQAKFGHYLTHIIGTDSSDPNKTKEWTIEGEPTIYTKTFAAVKNHPRTFTAYAAPLKYEFRFLSSMPQMENGVPVMDFIDKEGNSTTHEKAYQPKLQDNTIGSPMAATIHKYGTQTSIYTSTNGTTITNTLTKRGHIFDGWYLQRKSDLKWLYVGDVVIGDGDTEDERVQWYSWGDTPDKWDYLEKPNDVEYGPFQLRKYGNGSQTNRATGVPNDVIWAYALWNPEKYKVQYVLNGGNTSSSTSVRVTYGQSFSVIPSTKISKNGYKFLGWTTNEDGTDDGYNWTDWSGEWTGIPGEDEWAIDPDTRTTTLYARWEPIGFVYIKDNDAFNKYMVYIYENDTNKFQQYIPYIHNGTEWVLYSGE